MQTQPNLKQLFITIALTLSLASCASYDFSRRIVQQGNLLPASLVDRLKIGMSKEDTATLLGNSLLSPLFSTDRWDYAYTWRRGSDAIKIRTISLYFNHGTLTRIERSS